MKTAETPESAPVYLRALTLVDLPLVLQWHNDRALYANLGSPFRFVPRETEEQWFRHIIEDRDQLNLAICIAGSDEHIGNIYLRDLEWISRRAEMHVFIGSTSHRRRGSGSKAIRQLLAYAFNDLGLHRIFLQVLAENITAINVYGRCGFVKEGLLRQHVFKQGEWKDVIIMGICRPLDASYS